MTSVQAKKNLLILIVISAAVRIVVAALTELGNDEVYYWTYALFPSLSYFDHPPMVGYLIRLTTLNLVLNLELFVRLGSIIFGSVNLWIIYKIGEKIKNPLAGLLSAFLYTSSLYGFVITGIFILPDTPQVFFWLSALYFLISSITEDGESKSARLNLIYAGILIGFAMLSKYHSLFLWIAAGAYIIIYNRRWLIRKELYMAVLLSFIIFIPVLVWNSRNDFISFTFQSGRVGLFSSGLNINTFSQEFFGQIFYNNPVNYIIFITALIALKKIELDKKYKRFLLLSGLPIILLFLFFSLTRSTFPHWSAPGYFSLILLASVYLACKNPEKNMPLSVKIALGLMFVIVTLGILQIKAGLVDLSKSQNTEPKNLGRSDVTLEMSGWKQIGEGFAEINRKNIDMGLISREAPVITHKWYDAAHVEYYAAYPLGKDVFAFNPLIDIRNYNWLNKKRKPLTPGDDAYYLTTSHDYKDPQIYEKYFTKIETPPDTIKVFRGDKLVEYAFVYRLKGLKEIPQY